VFNLVCKQLPEGLLMIAQVVWATQKL